MSEFLEIEIKEDSPDKVAVLNEQGTPSKYYVTAQEINAIVAAINTIANFPDNYRKFAISVSQTTNIVMVALKERVQILSLSGVSNVSSFSDFIIWSGNTPGTIRANITQANTDIANLSNSQISAGYTIQFKINLVPGQSNASAQLITQKI